MPPQAINSESRRAFQSFSRCSPRRHARTAGRGGSKRNGNNAQLVEDNTNYHQQLVHPRQLLFDGGKGENVGLLPQSNSDGAATTPSGKLHLESRHQDNGSETPATVFRKHAPPNTARPFLDHDAGDGVNAKKIEDGGSVHEATSIEITRPLNDTVFLVGGVVVAFDTRGFTPSADTPIEAGLIREYSM